MFGYNYYRRKALGPGLTVSTLRVLAACSHIWQLPCAVDTHSTHSRSETLLLSRRRTHLFLNSPMYTCRANSAKTMRQKMVSVITSANCLNECSSAFMMVFRPVGTNKKHPVHTGLELTSRSSFLMQRLFHNFQHKGYCCCHVLLRGLCGKCPAILNI